MTNTRVEFDNLRFSLKHMGWAMMATMVVTSILMEFRTVQKIQIEEQLNTAKAIASTEFHAKELNAITLAFIEEKITWVNGRVDKKFNQSQDFFRTELKKVEKDQLNQWDVIYQNASKHSEIP